MVVLVLILLVVRGELGMLVGLVVTTVFPSSVDSNMLSTVLLSSVGSNVLNNVNSLVALWVLVSADSKTS